MLLTTGVTFVVVSIFDKNKVENNKSLNKQKVADN